MIPVEASDDVRLLKLQELMDEAGAAVSFTEFDPFGERHGSWQRTIHKYAGNLDRYVVVALTSLDDHEEVAAIAGAEERLGNANLNAKFRRFDVGSIRLNGDDPNSWQRTDLKTLIDQAVRMAIEIEPLQLEDRQRLAS
jgi:hypothetical protein